MFRITGNDAEPDAREDINIVPLAWDKSFSVDIVFIL